MSDHKRCRACGRIEDIVIREEHEARMQARIERHQRFHAVPADWCPACIKIEELGAGR